MVMKRGLYVTTSILAIGGLSTPASSAEWEVRLGGYMEQFIAYATSDVDGAMDEDFDGVDTVSDAEIAFLPSITLDNGLKIGVNIQLEGNTNEDQIDESFLFINGSFGRILLGSENSAGNLMAFSAPDVGIIGINSGSNTAFIPFSGEAGGVLTGDDVFRGTLGSTFLENARNNDAQRITYFTPRFAGFQLGVSYARDDQEDDSSAVNCEGETCDFFDVGANYVNSFGDFNVAASARWGIASSPLAGGDDPQVFGFGLNLGYSGFTIGGSWAEQNNAETDDGQSFDVGISYETGPWAFSATYIRGSNVDDENFGSGADETLDQFGIGVNYALAQGVDINVFGSYVDFDEDFDDAGVPGGNDVDGFIIGTGVGLSF